jgi:hypothetical protein
MTVRREISFVLLLLAFVGVAWAAGAAGKWTSSNGDGVITEGKVQGDELSGVEMLKFQDMDLRIEYTAKLSGDELKITRKVADVATEEGIAKRVS